ncbi:MAG TPA: hypothetical protein VIM42_08345 [Clostridium sp.]
MSSCDVKGDRTVWVIKDQMGCFAHKGSIHKIDTSEYVYVSYKSFSEECRAYIGDQQAKEAMAILDKKKDLLEIDIDFHIEQHSLAGLGKNKESIQGENMVLHEIKVLYNRALQHNNMVPAMAVALLVGKTLGIAV